MPTVSADTLRDLTEACFRAAGCPPEDAAQIARLMVLSNLCGHDSHGVRQIPRYLDNIRKGTIVPGAEMTVVTETPTIAILDANRSMGHIAATRAAELCIAKARENRISAVGVRNLDHIGRVGAYPEMAVAEGMVGLCFTATLGRGNIVTPFGGIQGRYATNPLAAGFPNPDGYPILLDFATSVIAGNKIRVAFDRGKQTGEGWLIDLEGNPVRDPQAFLERKAVVLPLGGPEQGYKGYALAVMVEILAGILSGAGTFATLQDRERTNNVSFLITIDPLAFVSQEFYQREIRALVEYLHGTKVRPGDPPVMIPGEFEERNRRQREAEGIEIEEPVWQAIQEAAARLSVAIPTPVA
jgi:uncharacterized oxidoreductase